LVSLDPRDAHRLLRGIYWVINCAVTMMIILVRGFPTGVFPPHHI
jgi:hypothetical protein